MIQEIIEVSIDLVNNKMSLVHPDSTTDEVIIPAGSFIKIVGSGLFRDVLMWQADQEKPIQAKVMAAKPKRKKRKEKIHWKKSR